MNNGIDCPVDFVLVNENKVRLVALSVLLLAIVYIVSGYWIIIAFLVIDFLLRSFNLGKYSLLAVLAGGLVKVFNIKTKPVDQAPKRFAARMGLAFTTIILILNFLQFANTAVILSLLLCVFAFLESFLGFCVGCYVYSYWHKLFGKTA
jgi:hypothetical protein